MGDDRKGDGGKRSVVDVHVARRGLSICGVTAQ